MPEIYDMNDRYSRVSPQAELVAVPRDELERLRDLADDAHDAWTHMLPEWRLAVRAQSEDLYNALGALSTFVATRRGA